MFSIHFTDFASPIYISSMGYISWTSCLIFSSNVKSLNRLITNLTEISNMIRAYMEQNVHTFLKQQSTWELRLTSFFYGVGVALFLVSSVVFKKSCSSFSICYGVMVLAICLFILSWHCQFIFDLWKFIIHSFFTYLFHTAITFEK